jgi:hypothetical protein
MKKILIFTMIVFALFFYNCNKETPVDDYKNSSDYGVPVKSIVDSTLGFVVKIQDSTLYFAKANDLLKAMTILREMPVQERRKWEKSVGFVSAQTLIEDLQQSIVKIDDKDQFNQLLLANKELVKASPDDIYGIKARIYGFYPYITSKRGFFVSETYWGRAFDKKLYSCHYFNHEGYEAMSRLSSENDVSCANLKAITLDFNEDEEDNLKSYHHSWTSPTKITLNMHQYAINNPTKRSEFNMELVNSYAIASLSTTETRYQYYFIVYYNGTCCDPAGYSYYYAPYGGYQYFEPYGNGWRIKVPYDNYFDTHPWTNPNWDNEDYYREQYNVYWYNYSGRVDLECKFIAENRILWDWSPYGGSVIYFQDVTAGVKVGTDVYYHSGSQQVTVGPSGDNYIEKVEKSEASSTDLVYSFILSEYTSKPPAVFTGCVSGVLYSRFCGDPYYNFSFNF